MYYRTEVYTASKTLEYYRNAAACMKLVAKLCKQSTLIILMGNEAANSAGLKATLLF